jgi:hypothetical protein
MRTREEIEAALRYAEQRFTVHESVTHTSRYGSPDYHEAQGFMTLWAGRIDAYRFVLKIKAAV